MVRFEVYGIPAPQGSHKGFVGKSGNVIVTDSNAGVRPWREAVLHAAIRYIQETGHQMILEPVSLEVTFFMPRPKSKPKTIDVLPATMPDLDKLMRAIGDSLTDAGIWKDDGQVCDSWARKRYAITPDLKFYDERKHRATPGARINVQILDNHGEEQL
jgi:crossover junction endodeoxyribonuclease RusA